MILAKAGKNALVKASGSSIAFTDEATNTNDDQTYQIADTTKQVWDRTATITVKDGGSPTTESFTLNRLNGTVTFDTVDSTRTITLDGEYLPMTKVAEAFDFTLSISANNGDISEFEDDFMNRIQLLKDVTGDLTRWKSSSSLFFDNLNNGTIFVLEFTVDNTQNPEFRAWVLLSTEDINTSVDEVVEEPIEFEGTTDADDRAFTVVNII